MITLKKIEHSKKPEDFKRFCSPYFYMIEGAKKLDSLCTVLALTHDLKYIFNTDSCDNYQSEKFSKQDMLDRTKDLLELTDKMQEDATCWDCQYLLELESAHSHISGNMPECGHLGAPDESGIPDLNHIPEWCPISGQTKEFKDWCRKWALI